MADNFLESHYEEYLKRKAEWEQNKRRKKRKKSDTDGTSPVNPQK